MLVRLRWAGAIVASLSLTASLVTQHADASEQRVVHSFVGSSPCGKHVRQALDIPADSKAELVNWHLSLCAAGADAEPARFHLRCEYGRTVPGLPGLGKEKATIERRGDVELSKGTQASAEAIVYELEGALKLQKVSDDVLYLLTGDRTLMPGNGGWSYALNRADATEKPGDAVLAIAAPSVTYTMSPLATGPEVFGVFEGRTPWNGIARQLGLPYGDVHIKAKWRMTLYQDPASKQPTTYKLEGSLFRHGAREGTWTMVSSGSDAAATMLRLQSAGEHSELSLLKADDNVLFLLGFDQRPLVGHAEFSYVLTRRGTFEQ